MSDESYSPGSDLSDYENRTKAQYRMGVDMLAKMALFKNYQKTATYYTWLER